MCVKYFNSQESLKKFQKSKSTKIIKIILYRELGTRSAVYYASNESRHCRNVLNLNSIIHRCIQGWAV